MENINQNQFESLLDTDKLVLIDIWASWCGPCRQMKPEIEKVITAYSGRVTIVGLDADANPELTTRLNVSGMPTLLLFKNKECIDRRMGFQTSKEISKLIENAI